MTYYVQMIPPKTLALLIERSERLDGCVVFCEDWFDFAQGSNVASVNPKLRIGHTKHDPQRANEIRAALKSLDEVKK